MCINKKQICKCHPCNVQIIILLFQKFLECTEENIQRKIYRGKYTEGRDRGKYTEKKRQRKNDRGKETEGNIQRKRDRGKMTEEKRQRERYRGKRQRTKDIVGGRRGEIGEKIGRRNRGGEMEGKRQM
jgi:hypothetical protein